MLSHTPQIAEREPQGLGERLSNFLAEAYPKTGHGEDLLSTFLRNFLRDAQYYLSKNADAVIFTPPKIDFSALYISIKNTMTMQSLTYGGNEAINVWQLTGIGRNELRNAAIVAWLISPTASHGLGARVLEKVIAKANLSLLTPIRQEDLESATVRTERYPLIDIENRVDIEVIGSDFVLFIEVKIDAGEGNNQLQRYLTAIKGKSLSLRKSNYAMIFLSNKAPSLASDQIAHVSWKNLREIIFAISKSIDGDKNVLRHLLSTLSLHIDF